MRSQSFITAGHETLLLVFCCTLLLIGSADGQRLAILTPDNTTKDIAYSTKLAAQLPSPLRVLDRDQAETAFRSVTVGDSFNMTTSEARNVAAVIGCDAFLVVRSGVQRRTSLSRPSYFQAYAVHYLVNGRTGELARWGISSAESESEQIAEAKLVATVVEIAQWLSPIRLATLPAINAGASNFESVPDEGTPAAANLKPPIPYKRIKPEYTVSAFLFDIKATVDIEVDVSADGAIVGTKIVRWAGYGLDESVETAVRAMNWRPAMRNGKPLPMRVLLRYNFTKVDKD